MNDKADFTQGSILKKLIAFMMPVLGALILQAAFSLLLHTIFYQQFSVDWGTVNHRCYLYLLHVL
ncbi:hypothetical protein I260019D6_08190 [Dorea longicatena]